MRDPIWDGKNPHLWIESGSSGKELQESRRAGRLIASHVSLPLLAGSLKTAGSMSRLEGWCFWTGSIWGKKLKIGMRDNDCIADISCEFGEFCGKNSRVIGLRIGPFLPARLLFWFRSGQGRSGGRGRGGHCSRHGGLPGMAAAQSGKSCA